MRRLILAAGLLVMGASPGWAQTQPEVDRARLDIETGQDHFRAAQYRDAVREFRKALRVIQDPGLLWNIARSYEELGEVPNAVHYFEEFLRRFPEDEDAVFAEERLKDLRGRVPASVMVECGEVPGAKVRIDGEDKTGCGVRVTGLRPGAHVAELVAPGQETLEREFFVTAGERMTLGFEDLLARESYRAAPADGRRPGEPGAAEPGGWLGPALLVTGGLLAAGAGVLAWQSRARGREMEDLEDRPVELQEVRDLEDRSANAAMGANALFVAATAAFVGGALYTW